MGKTSAIPEVVHRVVPLEQECIYIANRHQLLQEMLQSQQFNPGECVYLQGDLEAVLETLNIHRQAFYKLLDDQSFKNIAKRNKQIDLAKLRTNCRELEQISKVSST